MSLLTPNTPPISNNTNILHKQNSTNIDFNYPSLNRKDLMYLSTVSNNDFPLRKFKQLHTKRNWSINLYNLDIEGSSPRKFGAFNQKIDYINKYDDIEKQSPKQLHIKSRVYVAIVENIDNLPNNPKYTKIPVTEFMPITRDFAFVVAHDFPADKIVSTAVSVDASISKAIIFDAFDMGNGQKSIAFTITIYPDHNMSDKELLEIQDKVIKNIESKCNAQLRA